MNTDANPFAGHEPNAAGGTEDLGCDFDLSGAARRAARTGCVFWRKRSRDSIITIPTAMTRTGDEPTRTPVQS